MAFNPNQPRVPAGNPGAGRWVKVWFGNDQEVFDDMNGAISASLFSVFGVRIDDVDEPLSENDVLPKSRIWNDGDPTDEFLDGTSTIRVSQNPDSIGKAMKTLGATSDKAGAGYFGQVVYLVGGDAGSPGEDPDELVIRNATVIGVYLREKTAFAPVLARI